MVFFCEQCGAHVTGDMNFCEQCGARLLITPGSSPTPPPAPVVSSAPATTSWFSALLSKTKKRSPSPDYDRIVLWVQMRYGSRLAPGMDANQVRSELEAIIRSERARGIPDDALKGFRSFIDQQEYGMLIQPGR